MGGNLGFSLAIKDSTIVAGEPNNGPNGAVHVFLRIGTWIDFQTIQSPAPGPQTDAYFGGSVAIDGNWLVVGSPNADRLVGLPGDPPIIDTGAVYVYTVNFIAWELATILRPPESAAGDHFGTSVALRGIALLGGAPFNGGAAYLYLRAGTIWRPHLRLRDSTGAPTGAGASVALADVGALVGAPAATVDGVPGEGVALFYRGIVPFFLDGFENGNFSAWSDSIP